jgi:hypothetical protein
LGESLKSCESAIRQLIGEPPTPESITIDPFELGQRVVLLESALATDNLEAVEVWREIKPQLLQLVGNDRIKALHQQLEQYDLPAALEILRSIIDEYPQLQAYSPRS